MVSEHCLKNFFKRIRRSALPDWFHNINRDSKLEGCLKIQNTMIDMFNILYYIIYNIPIHYIPVYSQCTSRLCVQNWTNHYCKVRYGFGDVSQDRHSLEVPIFCLANLELSALSIRMHNSWHITLKSFLSNAQ